MHQNNAPKSVATHLAKSGQTEPHTAPKKTFTSNLKAQLKDALADRSGNIAIIFGLMLAPTVALIGSSVDFGRAFSVRSQVQAALDSAALAGGREYQTTQNVSLAAQRATDFFTKSLPADLDVHLDSVNVDAGSKTVSMAAHSNVDTTFLGVTGMKSIEVSAESQSSFAQSGSDKDLEVALMLDITGSMCMPCSKMTDMKAAANDLIDILKD